MTVLLLDFDGVINAPNPPWSDVQKTKVYANENYYESVTYSPQVVNHLNNISGQLDIRWATSWCPHSTIIESAIGSKHFGCIFDFETYYEHARELKFQAALTVAKSGQNLIWIDDVEITEERQQAVLDASTGINFFISPDSGKGLTQEHFDSIYQFLNVVQTWS